MINPPCQTLDDPLNFSTPTVAYANSELQTPLLSDADTIPESPDIENPLNPVATDPTPSIIDTAEPADCWTKLGLPTEFIKSAMDFFILVQPLVSYVPTVCKLPLTAGIAFLGAIIGAGTTYCHYALNHANQSDQQPATPDLEAAHDTTDDQPLHWGEVVALGCDGVGHACEVLALTNGVVSNSPLSLSSRIILNISLLLGGFVVSWADIRSCYNNIRNLKKHTDNPDMTSEETGADGWTMLATLGVAYRVFFANLIFYGELIDNLSGQEADTPLGISINSCYAAGTLALLITLGTTYCQATFNTANQTTATMPRAPASRAPAPASLTTMQSTALVASMVAGAGELAASINFLANDGQLSKWPSLAVSASALVIGGVTFWPNVRTFKNTFLKHNANQVQLIVETASPIVRLG